MTAMVTERLERLRRYGTAYELAAKHPDGRAYRLAYCEGRGRHTILAVARKHAGRLLALTGDDGLTWGSRSRDGATIGDWRIVWTGRTEREAICAGELPWLGDLPISGLCPICGESITLTGGLTTDGRLIGSCRDAFTVGQWQDD